MVVRRNIKPAPIRKRGLMVRSFGFALTLIGLMLSSAGAPMSRASTTSNASNIGFVLYTKSYAPGTLNARWLYAGTYSGSGIATGGPKEGFAGHYHVRYFYDDGRFSDEYDLVIERTGDVYSASWITGGKVGAIGVGMEVQNGLAIGWRRVVD